MAQSMNTSGRASGVLGFRVEDLAQLANVALDVADEERLEHVRHRHGAPRWMHAASGRFLVRQRFEAPGDPIGARFDAIHELADRKGPIAADHSDPERVALYPAERNLLPARSGALVRIEEALDLTEPVRQHLADVGQHLGRAPARFGARPVDIREGPRRKRLELRLELSNRGCCAPKAFRVLGEGSHRAECRTAPKGPRGRPATVSEMTAWALIWYAAGLVGHSVMEVLTRAFYAQHDTKTPVVIGTIAMGLNVVFSILFSKFFAQIGWMPHGGLALANSLATALEATALFIFMRRRLHGIEGNHILRGFTMSTVAALGMGIGLWLWIQSTESLARWIVSLGGVVIGGLIYGIAVVLLRVPEIQILKGVITRRLLRRAPTSSQ